MDRLTEMEAFATVVDQGGFTDAAKKMGISKSAVSKHVSSLEARLGARLLNRTTRRVSPTEIGLAYYDRARRVLNDAGEADALVTSMQSAPSGLLRISVATDFGVNHLSPVLSDFLSDFPDITVNMVLNNRYVELISEGFDMAVRIGELEELAMGYEGVQKAFAMQAGRELRVIVESDKVTDQYADDLSFMISQKIQEEMQYPGQVRVTVIREKRATAYAR